jgi:hypothetical protein
MSRFSRLRLPGGAAALALVVAVLLPAASSVASPTARAAAIRPVPAGFVGVNIDGPIFPRTAPGVSLPDQLGRMVASGVDTVRTVFSWADAQPYPSWSKVPAAERSLYTNVAGVPTDFATTDELVADASADGLRVLPTVLYAPRWDVVGRSAKSFGRPARPGPYAAYLKALVARYGSSGSFWRTHRGVPIRQWQIWNEPDIANFWPTQPFARTYVALLKSAAGAIRARDRRAQVVLGGLANYSWRDLASVYAQPGARRYFDVVALHPYTAKPAGVITIISYGRRVMDAHGDRRKPIVADEVGWTSGLGSSGSDQQAGVVTTEQGQARNLAQLIGLLAADRGRLGLAGFDVYTWAGAEVPGSYAFNFAGLLRYANGTLSAKPALGAFRKAALQVEDCRTRAARAPGCSKR